MQQRRGHYLGTEADERWYKRYLKDGLAARGYGRFWYDERGFYFRRNPTDKPIFIPYDTFVDVRLGPWHAGRWAYGNPIVKIVWARNGDRLSSGFIVGRTEDAAVALKAILQRRSGLKTKG